MEKKGPFSLTVKVNLLILGILILISVGSTFIACSIDSRQTDRIYRRMTNQTASALAVFLDGDEVERISNAVRSDEFRKLRETAMQAGNEEQIRAWLREKGLYESFETLNRQLKQYQEKHGVKYVYIESVEEDGSFIILDPDEDLFHVGSREETPEEYRGSRANEHIDSLVSVTEYGWLCSAYDPILNSRGEPVAVVGVDIDMNDVMDERRAFFSYMLIMTASLTLFSLAAGVLMMRRTVTRPLISLARATKGFADSDRELMEKDVISLPIHSRDEIGVLYQEIQSMQGRIVEYMENLTRVTAEKERISAELDVATRIQEQMLPRIFPPFPERHEFEIFASMDPALEVGGDFYDFFLVDDDHLCMVIADVSGKGVPAALFMVIARTLIKNQAQLGKSPSEILRDVNNQLYDGNRSSFFVTVWLAILEISTGKGLAVNAGHEHPVLCRSGEEYGLVRYKHSPVMALRENVNYPEHSFELHPGDRLFVYTDGVPEARNGQKEFYGLDRMVQSLNRHPGTDLETLLREVREDVDSFVGDAPQFDDMTMLGLYYHGPSINTPPC